MSESCASCRFMMYGDRGNVTQMECHIVHPVLMPFRERTFMGMFPVTTADDWCGEYQPVKKEDGNGERKG